MLTYVNLYMGSVEIRNFKCCENTTLELFYCPKNYLQKKKHIVLIDHPDSCIRYT